MNFLQRTEGGAFYFIIICPVFLHVYYNNNLLFLDEFCVVLGSQLARALSVCFSPCSPGLTEDQRMRRVYQYQLNVTMLL